MTDHNARFLPFQGRAAPSLEKGALCEERESPYTLPMIFPSGLLAIAEELATLIPDSAPYASERNAAWLEIGKQRLKLNDFDAAERAFRFLTEPQAEAEFRTAAALWSADHPESEPARDLLRNTVEHIDRWEGFIWRQTFSELVEPICRILGSPAAQKMAWRLNDPFTSACILSRLADFLPDPGLRRETLRVAEEFAKATSAGNRDYALRHVIAGYKRASLEEDEERAQGLMSEDLELMNENETRVLARAYEILQLQPMTQPEPDSHLLRLRRFLEYGFNDLRVLFLAQCSAEGGLNDPEAEQSVMDPSFLRIAPPRPPSIYADPSQLDLNTLARSLLGRPKCQRDSDRPFIDGTGFLWIEDKQRLVVLTRDLFQNFAAIACGFPEEQVEQGLWYLFGEPFWLSSLVVSHDVPETLAAELTQAMMFPFSDYYMSISAQYSGSAFFMWWDLFSPACANPAIGVTALSVLERILALPNKECQVAALHGLSHLHPDPRAGAIIQRYLDQNLDRLSDDELAWVKGCLAGEVP